MLRSGDSAGDRMDNAGVTQVTSCRTHHRNNVEQWCDGCRMKKRCTQRTALPAKHKICLAEQKICPAEQEICPAEQKIGAPKQTTGTTNQKINQPKSCRTRYGKDRQDQWCHGCKRKQKCKLLDTPFKSRTSKNSVNCNNEKLIVRYNHNNVLNEYSQNMYHEELTRLYNSTSQLIPDVEDESEIGKETFLGQTKFSI